jgi:hypothetical protein
MIDVELEVDGDAAKARFFGGEDDNEYAKLVFTWDLLEDDERATRVLDEMADALGDAAVEREVRTDA